jgi:hypothetical protein
MINSAPQPQQMPNFERPQMPNFERPQMQENGPAPQPEVRIQLRRIQIPGPISEIFPFLNNLNGDMQKEIDAPRQGMQVQQVPLAVALSKVGITPDDLRNIQRMAEEKFEQHIRELVAEEDNDNDNDSTVDSDSNQSDEIDNVTTPTPEESSEEKNSNQEASSQQEKSEEQEPQILALGRSNFGRSLIPIQLPMRPEIQEAERAECE